MKSGELRNGYVTFSNEYITQEALKNTAVKIIPKGSILLAMYGATVGQVAILEIEATTNQAICHIIPDKDICEQRYLYWFLKSKTQELLDLRVGGGQPNISQGIIKKMDVPLPSLPEQRRIAAILDQTDALRNKRRESIAKFDELLQSVFLDMFGDPVSNSRGWEKRPLGEITDIVAPMVDPRKEEYLDMLHYGPDRISKESGELFPAKTAKDDNLISGKFLCNNGDVLYSKIRPYLNKVALVKGPCLCSADVYPVQPDTEQMTKEYLFFLLRSSGFLDYVAGFSRRANIPKINRKQFFGYEAMLPPILLQQEFSKKYSEITLIIEKIKDSLDMHNNLFSSLQQRAFRGDL